MMQTLTVNFWTDFNTQRMLKILLNTKYRDITSTSKIVICLDLDFWSTNIYHDKKFLE